MEGPEGTSAQAPAGSAGPIPAPEVRIRRLPAVARSVGAARHWLAERPPAGVSLRNLQLVVSELVTNCIVHAGLAEHEEIEVSLRLTPAVVRVEVADPGPGFAPPDPGAVRGEPLTGGHGLGIVSRLVDRWGVDSSHGARVWLEIDRR